ncbi:SDR family NAD(P)-dependent oxidoreductase [Gymnodinialimonas hymeniacidonis]|uniref:SDR family NAD(P)-dependent oxidoreductase n=1 Tax=Gymnodinialimonas hymeniacidonis TaxID=3126508 RepID=UPI0034C6DA60
MTQPENKHAVVTGGAQGLGLACAAKLADQGYALSLWDIDPDALRSAQEQFSATSNVTTYQVDICDAESVARAVSEGETTAGLISVLVHSAGIAGPNAPVADYDLAAWKSVIDIDLNGSFIVNKAVVPSMQQAGYGRIVNIASVAGKEGNPNASAYSAAKAGLIALTKSLGKELADRNIAVNCETPAAAKTRLFDQMSEEHIAYMLSKIPRGRFLDVQEAAEMIAWMASPENSFTTGAVFDLSGGRAPY